MVSKWSPAATALIIPDPVCVSGRLGSGSLAPSVFVCERERKRQISTADKETLAPEEIRDALR